MRATWRRKSTCRTEARNAGTYAASLLLASALLPSHAQSLRLSHALNEGGPPGASLPPAHDTAQPLPPMRLTMATPDMPPRAARADATYEEALLEVDVN